MKWAVAAWLLAAWLAAPAAAQPLRDAPWGPDQRGARDLEVRLDALPDRLALNQIEVVVEASDEYCKPKSAKFMGLTLPQPTVAHAPFFCKMIEAYAEAAPAAHRPLLSRQIWHMRDVAAHVAQLDLPLSKRYVALTRWRGYGGVTKSARWVLEEALWDRQDQRLLWLALRSVYTDDEFEKGRIWGMALNLKRYYEYQLPAVLSQRGQVRDEAPVPGGRWVPAAQIADWASPERAAIGFANNYAGSRTWPGRATPLPVHAAGQAPFAYKPIEWGQDSWFRHGLQPEAAVMPTLDLDTHALLEVPPGRYWVHSDWALKLGVEFDLQAGQLVVVTYARALVGADVPVLEDAVWWSKRLTKRSRHAFLEDRRAFVPHVHVDTWFNIP